MKGNITGLGRNASIASGLCKITFTAETSDEAEFLRSLFSTWFEGFTEEDDAVIEDRLGAVFERRGWSQP